MKLFKILIAALLCAALILPLSIGVFADPEKTEYADPDEGEGDGEGEGSDPDDGDITPPPEVGDPADPDVDPDDPEVDPEDHTLDPEDPALDPEDPEVDPEGPDIRPLPAANPEIDPETCEHEWGEWTVTKEPDYFSVGLETRTCALCGSTELRLYGMILPFPLTDVRADRWYTDAIRFCYQKGYMYGVTDKLFSLSGTVSRAMTVQIMAKMLGVRLSDYKGSDFDDVAPDRWYARAIKWAHDEGFAAGTSERTFAPDVAVSRQELAVFFYKMALAADAVNDDSPYADLTGYYDYDDLAAWARTQFSFAVGVNFLAPTTSHHLSPRVTVTRAQMARFLYDYNNYVAPRDVPN